MKEIIIKQLEQRHSNFRELAYYLHLREKDLREALETEAPEMRLIESIAKLLQVPLYSLLPNT